MLSFSKGFNNQQNVDTNQYKKTGRISPEEIIQRKYENNMKNINNTKQVEMKTVEQKNNGANIYNQLNAYNHMNKN